MKSQFRMRVLIPHWIEHNKEHADEFRRWAEGVEEAKGDILQAADLMQDVNQALGSALDTLGGPLEGHHHSYPHTHPHSH